MSSAARSQTESTAEAILDAASEVFADKGYEGAETAYQVYYARQGIQE